MNDHVPSITDDEMRAQFWHDRQSELDPDHGGVWVASCWCCCLGCDPDWGGDNPFHPAAMTALRAKGGS